MSKNIQSAIDSIILQNSDASKEQLDSIKKKIKDLKTNGETVPEAIMEQYNELANIHNDALTKLGKSTESITKNIRSHFVKGISDISDGFGGIFGGILDDIINNPFFKMASGFGKSILGGVGHAVNKFTGKGEEAEIFDTPNEDPELGDKLSNNLNAELLTQIEENTKRLIDIWAEPIEVAPVEILPDLGAETDEDVETSIEPPIEKKSVGLFSSFINMIKPFLTLGMLKLGLVVTSIGALINHWKDMNFSEIVNEIITTIKGIGDWIGNYIGDVIGFDGNVFENLGKKIGDVVFNAVQFVVKDLPIMFTETMTSIKESVLDTFNGIGDWMKQLFSDIADFFGLGEDKTEQDFNKENEGKSSQELARELNQLAEENNKWHSFVTGWSDEERARRTSLQKMLQEQQKINSNNLSSGIQTSGESRKQGETNISTVITNQSNQSQVNNNNGGGSGVVHDSSSSGIGAAIGGRVKIGGNT